MGSRAIIRGRNCILGRLSYHRNQIAVTINRDIRSYDGLLCNGILDDVHSGKSASVHTTRGAGFEMLAQPWLLSGLIDRCSGKRSSKVFVPLGYCDMWQTIRFASTNAARRPEFDSGSEHEDDQERHQEKEAIMKDCVDSTVDLGHNKTKSNVKNQEQSSMKQKFWGSVCGIGPAMKAVTTVISNKKDEFFSTLQHYWLGLRLLWLDVRISSRLMLKLANGKKLSRRERSQLTRTTADIFRLVPFSVFVIVPFMEFLLPLFLRLFPNMLPSTFKDKLKEQEALKRKLKARMEYAKFLQDTVKEMAREVTRSGKMKQRAEDIDQFIKKVRTGAYVGKGEILGLAKLFSDELTLENMSRPSLLNMCKYMGIQPYGTNNYLRFMLRRKLKCIQDDDMLIQREGVASLSEHELRQACRERGHLGLFPVEEMREEEEENEQEGMVRLEDKNGASDKLSVKEASDLARKRMFDKQEELCKISQALALLSSASSISKERQEFLSLVNKEIELYNSLLEDSTAENANEAYVAAKGSKSSGSSVSSALMKKINAMLKELTKEIDDVDTAIGDGWQLLDRDHDGKVTSEEVAAAATYLKHNLDNTGVEELIGSLSKDKDGKILVEDIVRLGTQADEAEFDDE
ncbi:uncharacterized protein [Lolium perenne]|uniref:uncharacterized protein isoform X2 n=1 Tax=Lolium perenne TaxID=4522 RepID=UPI0021F5D082|nr:uncharacterized protein LOC127345087 isoform X2 [Lolium perenne]